MNSGHMLLLWYMHEVQVGCAYGAEAVSSTLEAVDYLEWDVDVRKNEESSSAWVLFSINKT